MFDENELSIITNNIGSEKPPTDKILSESWDVISILKKNLDESSDTEEIYDVSIDALNRFRHDFSFIAIFREDRKYSTAVRIRVDSDLVNRVEDYARKMMPEVTVMRYRIPIYEEGRLFRRFLLESKKPLITDNIKINDDGRLIKASMDEIYDNLVSLDGPLKLLLPAFKRIVPYKSAMSAHLFVSDIAVGNIGFASRKVMSEENLSALVIVSKLVGEKLDKIGFAKSYSR